MKQIIKYFLSNISKSKQSLEKKSILVDKPWALIDSDGKMQKLIFEADNGLILSKNGKVTQGTWKYFPAAKALFIDRGTDKILLQEQFINEDIMLLKLDGTEDDFFALANERTIPDLNVPAYLEKLSLQEYNIVERKLADGTSIRIILDKSSSEININNKKAVFLDATGKILPPKNGIFLSHDHKISYSVANGLISQTNQNAVHKSVDGETITILNASQYEHITEFVDRPVYKNGQPARSGKIFLSSYRFLLVNNGIVSKVLFLRTRYLANGIRIQLEQSDFHSIFKGDRIISSDPVSPVPDGRYRLKNALAWIKLKDNVVVYCFPDNLFGK